MADSADNGTTLLVVDNSQEDVFLLQKALSQGLPGCRVITSLSVEDGLAIAAETSLDGALIDVQMPTVDGIEMCRRLKATPSTAHIPVILMTGRASNPALKTTSVEVGPDDFISKPIDDNELIARIKVMLRIKRAEEALRSSERKSRAIFEHAGSGMFIVKADGRFADVNQEACRHLGYGREELLQMGPADITTPEHAKLIPSRSKELARDGQVAFESVHVRKDGTLVPVRLLSRHFEHEGQPAVLTVCHDVTERNRAEQKAEDERRRFYSALEMLPGHVCLLASDYTIRFANRRFFEVAGPPEGKPCYELLRGKHTPCWNRSALRVLQTGQPQEWEETGANGQTYHVWGHPFADVDGTEMVLELGVDITERKELEKEVVEANETVLRSIGRDLHDTLGQNLTGLAFLIKGLAQKLAVRFPEETVRANEIVGIVNECVSQTQSLARGLDPVGLHGEGLVAGLGELATSTERMFGTPCTVRCAQWVVLEDKVSGHLYRIAQEAVTNAVKHAGASHICITLSKDDHALSLTVEDDGSGIQPDAKLKGNKGMGMHIMRYRASVIGGTLNVAPGPQGGTVVTCSLIDSGNSQADGRGP